MKKGKKFIVGIVLIILGVIGLFGMFGNTEDKSSLAIGSVLLVATGVALILFEKKKPVTATATDSTNKSYSFKVAGVTFKNDDGKSRQTILRKIRWNDEPFETVEYSLKKYDFQGEPAIGVYANGKQIGNVPKTEVSHILPLLDKITSIKAEISGGGYTENNEVINYGVKIIISYK